jgi:hypothetical protein
MIAEVGLEPGPQLRSLHQRLLAGDPSLMEPLGARAQSLHLRTSKPPKASGARPLQRASVRARIARTNSQFTMMTVKTGNTLPGGPQRDQPAFR